MLGITSMIPTRCEGPDYSLFAFIHPVSCLDTCCLWSNSPRCHHLVLSSRSIPEPTTVIRARRYFSCVCFMILSFTCPNTMADAPFFHWCLYYIQPHAPLLQQKHSTLLLSVLSLTRKHPVSRPYFPNAVCERQLHKTAIHKQGYGSPAFKKTPAHHSL